MRFPRVFRHRRLGFYRMCKNINPSSFSGKMFWRLPLVEKILERCKLRQRFVALKKRSFACGAIISCQILCCPSLKFKAAREERGIDSGDAKKGEMRVYSQEYVPEKENSIGQKS
ncbi:hypothetical protein TNCV_3820371 [Trichonephila clavipes]|nr:hypothetical protein TNCV_3820371 [Trichonephila clavipes]